MMRTRRSRGGERGLTLVELVCCSAIILVLASVAIPVANTWVKRRKELELRQALREIRTAIDRFQADTTRQETMAMRQKLDPTNEEGYPEKLEWLYEGFDTGINASKKSSTIKYLRRLPRDPITGKQEWATRSSRDRPDSLFSDGRNIFDVRSTSDAVALDGTRYAEW